MTDQTNDTTRSEAQHAEQEVEKSSAQSPPRRQFLSDAFGLTAAGMATGFIGTASLVASPTASASDIYGGDPIEAMSGHHRQQQVYNLRKKIAQAHKDMALVQHASNGDDARYGNKLASYTKGMPHNILGEVDPAAYSVYAQAIDQGDWTMLAQIPMGNPNANRLTFRNIASIWAIEMAGLDSHNVFLKPAPAFASAETAGEMVELYWQALTRDVPLSKYGTDPKIAAACADLSSLSDFRGPKQGGAVTPDTIFRAGFPGCTTGPYLSQLFMFDIQYGPYILRPQIITAPVGQDYLTQYGDWLNAQNGFVNTVKVNDPSRRYMRSGRDLGEYVGRDILFQPYVDAGIIIMRRFGGPVDLANPYIGHPTQHGHSTFSAHHMFDLVTRVARMAQLAAWWHKWALHRRLRPEEYGGRVHNHVNGAASYPLHPDVLDSVALDEVFSKQGTYLLSQQFPEGVPPHPAYPAGHAAIAGACATVLKAMFNENFVIPNPVVPADDGLSLLPWAGTPLTLGNEINKLAANISLGRDTAGVHWRSDSIDGMLLGEEVAIQAMRDQRTGYFEPFTGFSLTKFDGTTITI